MEMKRAAEMQREQTESSLRPRGENIRPVRLALQELDQRVSPWLVDI